MLTMLEIGILSAGLGINSIMDLRTKKISLKIMLILFISGCVFRVMQGNLFTLEFVLGLLPGGICLALSYMTRGNIGIGDGFMFLVLGAFLSIEELFVTSMIALGSAGIAAMVLLIGFHKKKNYEIPFVPFMFVGFVITKILYGG